MQDFFFATDSLIIVTVLAANIVIAEVLARYTFARHLGTTLLVMVMTAITSNLGVIPTSAAEAPIYSGILQYITPLAIFWLLLRVNLRDVLQAGLPMLLMFLIGSAGTVAGVLVGMWLLDGSESIGLLYRAIGGVFVGTYTGGGVNFSALALHYGVVNEGPVFAGITAVDNILTTVWMVATIAIPAALVRFWPFRRAVNVDHQELLPETASDVDDDTESLHPIDVGILLAAGLASIWVSENAALWYKWNLGINLPSIVLLTTIALVLAQLKIVQRWRGTQVLGLFAMYFFLAVIGASCDVSAFAEIGQLGVTIFLFAAIVIAVHGAIVFAAAALFRIDVDIAAVASQANIGGATTALGVARSLHRRDLVLPAVLVGSLGYAIGTYLGFVTAEYLL